MSNINTEYPLNAGVMRKMIGMIKICAYMK